MTRTTRHVIASFVLPALLAGTAFAFSPETAAAKKSGAKTKTAKAAKVNVADFTQDGLPNLQSAAAVVYDQASGQPLFSKNAELAMPIASITKLMTAMVVLDAAQNLEEPIVIEASDVDTLKNSRSRLPVGTAFRREDLMRLALLASDNRAAAALGRNYPGGSDVFVAAMNAKARAIGMRHARFLDATGLAPGNVASPQDLAMLVAEAAKYPHIREFSTAPELYVTLPNAKKPMGFSNTNQLVKNQSWTIGVSKTGFINEAGKCLVMQATIANNPVIIVLLDSWGRLTRVGDANRIKKWIETGKYAASRALSPAQNKSI